MKTIPFQKIHPNYIRLRSNFSICYKPHVLKNKITNRPSSSFIFIEFGNYEYCWNKGSLKAVSGDVLYIPQGGTYQYSISGESVRVHQIDFYAYDLTNSPIAFSCEPMILGKAGPETALLFNQLTSYTNYTNAFKKHSLIYSIIAAFYITDFPVSFRSKIAPAVRYILENYNQKIYSEELSRLCCISISELRKRFKNELSCTPLEYQNELKIKKAKNMLINGDLTIKEIALFLGFESLYSFSLFFKKKTGLAPTKYVQQNNLSK